MSWHRYSNYAPYVPAATRRANAAKAAKKMVAKGEALDPVAISGRKIATSFWGQAWCDNLESYSDYFNRLPRGRTYARNGSVIDLKIQAGSITGLVQGSSLYRIKITIQPLKQPQWAEFKKDCAGQIFSLLDLVQGRLDKALLQQITKRPGGLFPAPKEIKLSCDCPDGASMCKHVAAVLYGVGARLDRSPELFFTLREVDMAELISAASDSVASDSPSSGDLDPDDLSAIFGVDMDPGAATASAPSPPSKKKATKPAAKKAAASKKVALPAKKKPMAKKTATLAKKKPVAKKAAVKKVAAKKKAKRL